MKKTVPRRLTSALCALVLLLSLVPPALAAGTPAVSNNSNANTYGLGFGGNYWADTIKSYLFSSGGGLTRVEYLGDQKIIVEDYSASFQLQSSRTIPFELSRWGGFFAGQSCNFFIFGQDNPGESDGVEVIRVVKYDKSWNRLGQASVCGANTCIPFDAGSLRCAEYGGTLYIHTSHKMYKSSDGVNHQANMNIAVRQSDMQVTGTGCGIGGYSSYVSHSFNQFILFDQSGRLVTADHGDGSPRALEVTQSTGTSGFCDMAFAGTTNSSNVQEFPGAFGQNATGCSVGALAETGSGYLTAYNNDDANSGFASRKIYLGYTDKASMTSRRTLVSKEVSVSTPHLAPTGLDGGWLLWNGMDKTSTTNVGDTLHYVPYYADGTFGAETTLQGVPLSDCAPICYNGKTVWYTTRSSAPVFYSLDASGVIATPANGSPSQVRNDPPKALPSGSGVTFSDVPASHWAYQDIASSVALGAVSGYKDGTFRPGDTVTIAEFTAMLGRVFFPEELAEFQAKPEYAGKPWYVPVCYALENDIFTGPLTYTIMADRRYDFKNVAGSEVNRFQMATMVYNVYHREKGYINHTEFDYLKNQITDYAPLSSDSSPWTDWGSVLAGIHLGILTGMPDGSYSGDKAVTRAQACAVINRLYTKVNS